MIKLSIIIPVYNVEKYLGECIESVIQQNLKEIEIICVNDGSTDNSLEILKNYQRKDSRIKIIDKENSGYGHTMNKGMEIAKGKYIGIVESDDFVPEEMFQILYNAAEEQQADVVKSNYYAYRATGSPHEEFVEPLWDCVYNQVFNPMDMIKVFKVQPCIWSAIYRRDLLESNHILFNETPGASYQDTSFAFKVWFSAKRVYFIKDALLRYRSDNENSSVQSPAKVYCICDEFKVMEDYAKLEPDKMVLVMPMLVKMKLREYKWNYGRLAEEYRTEFMDKMREEFLQMKGEGYLESIYLSEDEYMEIQSIIKEGKLLH